MPVVSPRTESLRTPEPDADARPSRTPRPSRAPSIAEQAYVLVVEDDPDLADVIAMSLESEGYEARIANDGKKALDVVRAQVPALVLLDMRMPVMDGWAFARAFRDLYGTRTPVVVMTAAESAAARAIEIDAEASLHKPFHLDALLATVARFVPKARRA